MRTNNALQIIFAFFLGLVVVTFIGIGVATFYTEPSYHDNPTAEYASWRLTTGIIVMVCATILLAVSLVLPMAAGVLSNGLLMGGVFTMIYAVFMAASSDTTITRFVVIAIALAVTIAFGYLRFTRRRGPAPVAGADAGTVPVEVAERLAAVERKLDALGRALQG
jgi:uncharacterized membrane protein